MHADLLLSDIIDEIEENRGAFSHHKAHIDTELAEKPPTEVLLGHSHDRLHFFHRQRCHSHIIEVDNHDPIFDQARYKQLLDDKLAKKGSCEVQFIDFGLDFDHFANVKDEYWSMLDITPAHIQKATLENVGDLAVRNRVSLP